MPHGHCRKIRGSPAELNGPSRVRQFRHRRRKSAMKSPESQEASMTMTTYQAAELTSTDAGDSRLFSFRRSYYHLSYHKSPEQKDPFCRNSRPRLPTTFYNITAIQTRGFKPEYRESRDAPAKD